MVSKLSKRVNKEEHLISLRKFLKQHLDMSQKEIQKVIESGAVLIDQRKETFGSKKVKAGQTVQVALPQTSTHKTFEPPRPDVLWENENLLAANKPAGIPSQRTKDPKRYSMEHWAKEYPGSKLYLTHRLDRDTSGVLLFAKNKEMETLCFDWFKHRRVQKVYHAICYGKPRKNVNETWVDHLGSAPKRGGRNCFQTVRSGGLRAETEAKLLSKHEQKVFWELRPHTGRTHQLRVQLAARQMPIVGDDLYDTKHRSRPMAPHHLLHARELHLPIEEGQGPTSIVAPYPKTWKPYLKEFR